MFSLCVDSCVNTYCYAMHSFRYAIIEVVYNNAILMGQFKDSYIGGDCEVVRTH